MTLGGLAILLTLAQASLNFILALSPNLARASIRIPAFIAAGLDIIAFLFALYFSYHLARRNGWREFPSSTRWKWLVLGMGTLCVVLAAAAGALALIRIGASVDKLPEHIVGIRLGELLIITWTFWGLFLLSQAVLCAIASRWPQHGGQTSELSSVYHIGEGSQMVERNRARGDTGRSYSSSQRPVLNSPPRSPDASEHFSSIRSSLSAKVKSSHSRTRLIRSGRDSNSFEDIYREPLPMHDGFDTWDTSAVGAHIRETVLQSSPTPEKARLDPIPGSRPESPATALEGPFLPQSPHLPSSTPSSPTNFSRPHFTRQRSATMEENVNVHPLFRPDSPHGPPPSVSPGTAITVDPEAANRNSRATLRIRSGSLPTTPSTLKHSQSLEYLPQQKSQPSLKHSESFDYFPFQSPPRSPVGSIRAAPFRPSRQNTPDIPELFPPIIPSSAPSTPPPLPALEEFNEHEILPRQRTAIPDFILAAGSRSSFVGYGKRKTSYRSGLGEVEGDMSEEI